MLCSFCIRPWLQVAALLKNWCAYLPELFYSASLATSKQLFYYFGSLINYINFRGIAIRLSLMTCIRGI